MNLDAVLGDEAKLRQTTLLAAAGAPEHLRSAFATKLAVVANDAAEALVAADEAGQRASTHQTRLARACSALASLGVAASKTCLLRLADEGTHVVKTTLAHALRGTPTAAGRSILLYLLSDDDAQADALAAIGVAPWPEVLPHLMEVAEGDDRLVRLALKAIARCGASGGPGANERYAAADFLLEQLDDESVLPAALDALLRFGTAFPGVHDRARELAKRDGLRRIAGLCLVAATSSNDGPRVPLELATGPKTDEAAARKLLAPLLRDLDPRVRSAAEEASRVLGFG